MILTLQQAAKELKQLREDERNRNFEAINRRYGNSDRALKAEIKMRDFLLENDYCTSCYKKKVTAEDFSELNCGLCDSCYMKWEDNYLNDGL